MTSTQSDVLNWVTCLAANRLPKILETKDTACSNCGSFVPKRPKTLKGMCILQQMEQVGRPIGTIIYSKASHWPSTVFTWLHSTNLWVLHSLVTTNQYSIWHPVFSITLRQCIVYSKEAFVSTFHALLHLSDSALSSLCVHHEFMHICSCSLCIYVHSQTCSRKM